MGVHVRERTLNPTQVHIPNASLPFLTTPTLQTPSAKEMWFVKGALDVILKQCTTLPDGSPLTSVDVEHFNSVAHDLGLKGLRGQRLKFQVGVTLKVFVLQWLPWRVVQS